MSRQVTFANQALRFLAEIAGLIAIGYWGYHRGDGSIRWLLMLLPPLAIASIWAVFRVPNDPGDAPVAIPGYLRLGLEFIVFGLAVMALYAAGLRALALVFAMILLGHYALDWKRIRWLLRQ